MANYLLDYRGFKAIFEAANEEVDAMIAAAKASDEGTEVPQKPAYEPLFLWFADNAVKGSDDQKNNDARTVKQSIQYWTGNAGRIAGESGGGKIDKALAQIESFEDAEKLESWKNILFQAMDIKNEPTIKEGPIPAGIDNRKSIPNPKYIDSAKLAAAVKLLRDRLKELKTEGWEFGDNIQSYTINYTDPAKSIKKDAKLLNYTPYDGGTRSWFEYTKVRQWEDDGNAVYRRVKAWSDYIIANISTMIADLQKPAEPIFKKIGVPMELNDKIKILDIIQASAEKYLKWDKAKYDTTSEAIQNAYSIKISPKGKVQKTEKTTVVSEPTKTETTKEFSTSIATEQQAKGMFKNNEANFAEGFTETLINAMVTSFNEVKKTEGFSKFISITIKPVASTNVIPTTFSYKGKTGNEALAQARLDALLTQIVNPTLEQMQDIKALAKIDMVKGLAPNNSNETLHPGSSKWKQGGNVDDEKYAEYRYSTVIIDITYETTLSSTTPGEMIEDVSYAGEWAVNIMIPKPSSGGSSTPGGQQYKRVPKRWLNKRSSDTVPPCKRACPAAYDNW